LTGSFLRHCYRHNQSVFNPSSETPEQAVNEIA
jgi:hypothetical protein